MDLDNAIKAHAEWKLKLRTAIAKTETLNVTQIAADNCCELGKWLHGPARLQLKALPSYSDVVTKHATFHKEAGRVATEINARHMDKAAKMLEAGTPYAMASSAVGLAIGGLKQAMAKQPA